MGTFLAIASVVVPAVIGIVQAVHQDQEQKRQNALQANIAKQSLQQNQENLQLNKETSEQNFELQKEQFEYQKQLNDTVMQREDTAMQRQVADLQAAGLSPLMVSGGASATPLTSATAPQKDMSGMNQALSGVNTATGNMMSAYNDIFNRKMQKKQFQLQAITSMSQLYTNLMESRLNQKKIGFENQILELDKKYYESHPERNLGIQQILANLVSDFISKNNSSVTPDLVKDKVSDVLHDSGLETPSGDFRTYGALNPDTKYSHTLDNINYDNNRSTGALIAQETKEKFYKTKLKKKDTEDIRKKLYATDDYLKKHISLENWLKKDKDFISFYLKYGKFEGHKKYFE